MLDYSCERHKLSPAASIEYIANHKGLAIGNGLDILYDAPGSNCRVGPRSGLCSRCRHYQFISPEIRTLSTVYLIPSVLHENATHTIPLYIIDAVKRLPGIFCRERKNGTQVPEKRSGKKW